MKQSIEKWAGGLSAVAAAVIAGAMPVSAASTFTLFYNATPRRVIIIIISVALVVGVFIYKLKKGGSSGGFSNTHFDLNSKYNPEKPEDYMPNEKEIERLAFMYQAGQKTGQKKAETEGKVMVKCPNCGAPVRFAEIMECDYCKTQITRVSVADQLTHQNEPSSDQRFHKDPPVREFNPNRYYDENITGYDRHDEVNQDQEVKDYYNDYSDRQ